MAYPRIPFTSEEEIEMNWLQRKNGHKQITTTPKRMTQAELDVAVKDLTDRGWTIVSSGTYQVSDSTVHTSSRRSTAPGMSKTSSNTMVTEMQTRYWCKLLSPKREENVAI